MGSALPSVMGDPGSVKLLFHNQLAQIDRDPEVLAQRLAQHYPLLDFGPRQGHKSSFLHRTSTCQTGDLILSCGYTTPIRGTIGAQEGIGSVNMILSGNIRYEAGGKEMVVDAHRPFFFSPGQEYRYTISDHFNGVVFHIDLQRLRQTAASMAGLGVSERRFCQDLDLVRALQPRSRRSEALLQVLRQTLRLLDHPELELTGDLDHLRVDDLIYRNLALLLFPRLEALIQTDDRKRSERERIFDDVLEWTLANLHRPISLSQLEQRSGYSRRNLQLAFQQRFGCGPIQWVRQQRLDQARRELLNPETDDSVASVSARYGFSSPCVFSRDFKARFGLRPSEVLREGKRHNRLP
jgi:AraC-like DNA-binding protein